MEDSIKCPTCEIFKHPTLFYKNRSRSNGLSRMCKECRCEYERNVIYQAKVWWLGWKAERGCFKCGDKRAYVLELHHIDPSQKEFTIGTVIGSGTSKLETRQKRVLKEAEKCEVVCANCHKEIHHLIRENKVP